MPGKKKYDRNLEKELVTEAGIHKVQRRFAAMEETF